MTQQTSNAGNNSSRGSSSMEDEKQRGIDKKSGDATGKNPNSRSQNDSQGSSRSSTPASNTHTGNQKR